MMVRGRIADAATTRAVTALCQEFPDETESIHSKSYFSEEDGLESCEGDDTEEEWYKSSQFQLKEQKDGE